MAVELGVEGEFMKLYGAGKPFRLLPTEEVPNPSTVNQLVLGRQFVTNQPDLSNALNYGRAQRDLLVKGKL